MAFQLVISSTRCFIEIIDIKGIQYWQDDFDSVFIQDLFLVHQMEIFGMLLLACVRVGTN